MVIIDKNKDFYDYLSTIYGRDTRLVYKRDSGKVIHYSVESIPNGMVNHNMYMFGHGTCIEYLLIVDKLYLISRSVGDYFNCKIITVDCPEYEKLANPWRNTQRNTFKGRVRLMLDDNDFSLAMASGHPIQRIEFPSCIDGEYKVTAMPILLKNVANLHQLPSIEQIYQKIELFLGMQKDAAMLQEEQTPNNIKVLQAGFDLKQSFRHRK